MNSVSYNDLLKENQLLRTQLGQKHQEMKLKDNEIHSAERKMRLSLADSPEQMKTIADLILEIERLKNKLLVAHQRTNVLLHQKEELEKALTDLYEEYQKPEPKKSIWKKAINLITFRNE